MRTVELAAATVMLFSAPVASPSHAVRATPVTPHVQVAPRKATKPADIPLVCKTPDPGWVAWFPGQVAPYVLYGSTVDAQEHYEAPPGYVVLIFRWQDANGFWNAKVDGILLSEWCH